jgi:hypothetical protein
MKIWSEMQSTPSGKELLVLFMEYNGQAVNLACNPVMLDGSVDKVSENLQQIITSLVHAVYPRQTLAEKLQSDIERLQEELEMKRKALEFSVNAR